MDDAKKPKASEWMTLLGLLMLVVGVVSLVLGHFETFTFRGAVAWTIAGLFLLLNGLGVIPRKKKA